jgi:hypothetical protein
MTSDVMREGIDSRGQKENDKTPEEDEVHHPGVGIAKKAPVGQKIHNGCADENRYSLAYVLRAVIWLPQVP